MDCEGTNSSFVGGDVQNLRSTDFPPKGGIDFGTYKVCLSLSCWFSNRLWPMELQSLTLGFKHGCLSPCYSAHY